MPSFSMFCMQVHRLLHGLPLPAVDAVASGLIDGLCYRYQVPGLLLAGSSQQSSWPAADHTPHTEQAAEPYAVPPAASPPSEQLPVVRVQRYLEASGIHPAQSGLLQLAFAALALLLGANTQAASSDHSWLEASPYRAGRFAWLHKWRPGQHMAGAHKPKIAVMSVVGALVETGGSPVRMGMQQQQVASSVLCCSLEQARQDPAVRAVVLRVDSPDKHRLASSLEANPSVRDPYLCTLVVPALWVGHDFCAAVLPALPAGGSLRFQLLDDCVTGAQLHCRWLCCCR